MKPQKKKNSKPEKEESGGNARKMNRKEAIKKTGYVALSAATMMLLLSKPENAHAGSPAPPPVW